ncbi:MAG: hypothetical protein M3Z17_09845 [Gemmatimonadota bacterium]|nr:hypothetical protein [Gemmatimonadota bacterium]
MATSFAPLPAGTMMMASIQQSVLSDSSKTGGEVAAILSRNVVDDAGRTVIPGGSSIVLTIAQLGPAKTGGITDGVVAFELKAMTVGSRSYSPSADIGVVPHRLVGAETPTHDRGIVVSAGTPIAITLTRPLTITAN